MLEMSSPEDTRESQEQAGLLRIEPILVSTSWLGHREGIRQTYGNLGVLNRIGRRVSCLTLHHDNVLVGPTPISHKVEQEDEVALCADFLWRLKCPDSGLGIWIDFGIPNSAIEFGKYGHTRRFGSGYRNGYFFSWR